MYKKILALGGLMLLGAGCTGQAQTANKGVNLAYGTTADSYEAKDLSALQSASFQAQLEDIAEPATQKPAAQQPAAQSPQQQPSMQTPFPVLKPEDIAKKSAVIKTAKGDIVFKFFGTEGPIAASNFIALTEKGFYNGLTFHRREEGFVIQGGDPNGNGTGGPGYQFQDEPVTRKYSRGIVAMANAGADTNGSQFFIMLADVGLPPNYTIFGEVTQGMEVVDKIQVGDKMTAVEIR